MFCLCLLPSEGWIFFCALAEDSDTKFSFLTFELLQLVQMCFVVFFDFWRFRFCKDFVASKNSAKWPTKKPGKKTTAAQMSWAKGAKKSGKVSEGNHLTPKTSVWIAWKNGVFFLFGVEHGGWSEIFLRSGCKGYSCIFQMEVPSHFWLVNFGRLLAAASELMGGKQLILAANVWLK